MSVARLAGILAALLASGCVYFPASHVVEEGDLDVEITAFDAESSRLQLSLRNASNVELKYVWLYATYDESPRTGRRDTPFAVDFADGTVMMGQEVPLFPRERDLVELGKCGKPGQYVGIAVCRDARGGCPDYDVVWSRTPIPETSINPDRLTPVPKAQR